MPFQYPNQAAAARGSTPHGITEFVVVPPMYSAWPVNQNDWLPRSKAAPQLTSNMKLSFLLGALPWSTPLLASMKAVTSVLKKMKPGMSQESRAPGNPLKDVGVAVEVNAPDQCDIPHRSCAHRPVREPTQAQGGIPFAVDLYVVESVVTPSSSKSMKKKLSPSDQLDACWKVRMCV